RWAVSGHRDRLASEPDPEPPREPPPRHRRPARDRLRPADPLPPVHVLRRRLGLARQERAPGHLAAGADAVRETLADGPDLPDLGHGCGLPAQDRPGL